MMLSRYDYPDGLRYYDEGWNAFCRKDEKPESAHADFWDGWKDCAEAPEQDRKEIE